MISTLPSSPVPDPLIRVAVAPLRAVVILPAGFLCGASFSGFQCDALQTAELYDTKPITMQDISDGKSCGVCHNGRIAFPGDDLGTCSRCHTGT